MKKHKADRIRNIGIVGHGSSGKTSLTESLLFAAGASDRLGRVDEGTTVSDFDADEVKRKVSINASLAPCEWKDHKINLIDAPGFFDFVGDVKGMLRVVDCVAIVLDAVPGLEVGAEIMGEWADERSLPRFFVVNKMDRENADFFRSVDALIARYGTKVAPIQVPIGSQDAFQGIVDVIDNKAYIWQGGQMAEAPVPADLQGRVQEYRDKLVEAVAETDDDLINKFLEGEELTREEIVKGLKAGIQSGVVVPVVCASGIRAIGMQPMLDFMVNSLPSPLEMPPAKGKNPQNGHEVVLDGKDESSLAALVFKTMADPYVGKLTYFRVFAGVLKSDSHVWNANKTHEERIGQVYFLRGKTQEAATEVHAGDIGAVAKLQDTATGDSLCEKARPVLFDPIEFPNPIFSLAIKPKTKTDEDKMGPALQRLAEEDPTFHFRRDPDTGQTVISGMGESHLDVIVDRIKRKFGSEVTIETPKVPYRETITGHSKVQGRHKKQTGGRGQFGDCWVEFEPLPKGSGFEFADKVVGGAIPRQYIPAVEKGIVESMSEGIQAGYPVVDLRASVYDGSFHPVDSSEMAFKIAGQLAFKKGTSEARPVILEPILNVEVTVPEECMGDVIGDLNTKRGRVLGMESIGGGRQRINAQVPMGEMMRYAIDLRSITRGRGLFTTEIAHYEEVPANISQQIIEQAKKEREKEE
ncbi:MAG: elongation factor G [Armatimonadetes bacterium]|nr:elongation factor G [Armatimonadota bacterium]